MKTVCPQCRKIVDFTAASCQNCRMSYIATQEPAKDFADICITIGGAVLIAAIGVIVTIVLHS